MRHLQLVLVLPAAACGAVVSENAFSGRWRAALLEFEAADAPLSAENVGFVDCNAAWVPPDPGTAPRPDGFDQAYVFEGCASIFNRDVVAGAAGPELVVVIDPPLNEVVVDGDREDLDSLVLQLWFAGGPRVFDMTELAGRSVELRSPDVDVGGVVGDAVVYLTKD